MSASVDSERGAREKIDDVLSIFTSYATLAIATIGVFLVFIGFLLNGVIFDNGVLAAMFGIWGASAIISAIVAYGLLWLNKAREDQTDVEQVH